MRTHIMIHCYFMLFKGIKYSYNPPSSFKTSHKTTLTPPSPPPLGGGLSGYSIAYHLAKLGHRSCTLITRDTEDSIASNAAAGMLGKCCF